MMKEWCGVVGAISKKNRPVAREIYKGMVGLQHRGQDAAGMILSSPFYEKKGLGLVSEVINEDCFTAKGCLGVGHTRYPTTGSCLEVDVQPIKAGQITIAHNGHIANYKELKEKMEKKGYQFQGGVDNEPLLYMLIEEIKNGGGLKNAVKKVMEETEGSYSIVGIYEDRLFAFRDPWGIRPLVMGENKEMVMFGSESIVFDMNDVDYVRSIKPGELIIVDKQGKRKEEILLQKKTKNCMFEYVYFSRPESRINDKSVYLVRQRLGSYLYDEKPTEADLVICVPDSSRISAIAYAKKAGIPYVEGLIKNRYVARTFIMPSQEKRVEAVKMKLTPVREVLKGKDVIIVDDSIVRGTTMKEIIRKVKKTGAKKVHLRIHSPPIKGPCFYGVDIPTKKELVANKTGAEEIKKMLGVDSLHYLSLESLKRAIGNNICIGCLTGEYQTEYIQKLADEAE
ncbi:amidophosphoribosyltransferase [Candidatus Micrarchaeota archaeon]|nr:amidophosphoribosyltransferase [Candidatus Micrarchaeota archaeon]